ncbi:MAG: nucleotide pyrophosphohydrolase [Desulfovibrio sp.]
MTTFKEVQDAATEFVTTRQWEQFQSPKNLSMALSGECGELLELFQWTTQEESRNLSPEKKARVAEEMSDILVYLSRIAAELDIDLLKAAQQKIAKNKAKYPVDKVQKNLRRPEEY